MSIYEYTALDEKGRERKGFVDAMGVAAGNHGRCFREIVFDGVKADECLRIYSFG